MGGGEVVRNPGGGREERASPPHPNMDSSLGRRENYPRLSRYIPAVGEVRGQGMKVPVCVSGEVGSAGLFRRCPLLPTQPGTAQSHQAALSEQGPGQGPLGTGSQPHPALLPQSQETSCGTGEKEVLSV